MKIKNAKCCALCVWLTEGNSGCNSSVVGTCINYEGEQIKVWSHNYCECFELYYKYEKEFEIKEIG
ncbi:MAG: hypothetical protein ACRCX2_17305 [Paraclostridium sp.]